MNDIEVLPFALYSNITESFRQETSGIIIKGVAIDSFTTLNGRNYAMVLHDIAEQLVGKPVIFGFRKDHETDITTASSSVGVVTSAKYDRNSKKVFFEAHIRNNSDCPDVEARLLSKHIPYVSIGGLAEKFVDMGSYVQVRGVHVTHLALAAVPGSESAKILEVKKIGESYQYKEGLLFNTTLRHYLRMELLKRIS